MEEEICAEDEEDSISDDEENKSTMSISSFLRDKQIQKCVNDKFDEKSANCFLCPISSCTFSLSHDDEKLRILHLDTSHPDIDRNICFLKLWYPEILYIYRLITSCRYISSTHLNMYKNEYSRI